MSKLFKGTNYKHGIMLDIDGSGGLGDERFIAGQRHDIVYSPIAAANMATIFYIAPAPFKVISAIERHVTVAGQAGSMQVEKVASGVAIGSGTALLASAFDLTSTASTNVTILGSATLATASVAKCEALALKVASGAATSYANGSLVLTIEWL